MSNISQFAVHSSIRQVTDALYERRRGYISFPMSREKQLERQTGFVRIADFPRAQGAIDCTHVALRALQNHPVVFGNCGGFHSLSVQLVCNHSRKITTVDARYPGSSHEAFTLRQTGVPGVFAAPNQDCGWLLVLPGDLKTLPNKIFANLFGATLCTWQLTPLRHPSTATQQSYNECHSATRCIIEQPVGILKQRFRCPDRSGGVLQHSPERVSLFVVVCCMLHHLVIMRGQPLEDEEAEPPEEEDQEEEDQEEEVGAIKGERQPTSSVAAYLCKVQYELVQEGDSSEEGNWIGRRQGPGH
uniref:putative nuclease HARBI1 n=1 Tax=Pristiophorus japonicus TaxID=55135 RepID=UPI00398ECFF8